MHLLNSTTLSDLPVSLLKPSYDRSALSTGIVHFGVGGFHRAHQAMYLDQLMNTGQALDWAICGVGVLPADARMKQVMDRQDCLYTLMVKNPDGTRQARVIGSIIEYLFAPADPNAVIEKMASASVRIVSLTVTEGGYNFHHVSGDFDAGNPDVVHDLLPGSEPRTTFGLITEALSRRRKRGLELFTVMSCDNIQGNGDVARKMFTAYARLKDPELGSWIAANVSFPNSMVDRITPVTTDEDRRTIADEYGVEDAWPVVCEPFAQWVLEDRFSAGRPLFEDAGVRLVDDVEPYELMKLRLLNASHQALCYFGYLAGYRYAHEACQDPLFARFLLDYMDKEGSPTLQPVPGIDLDRYKRTLIERFSNSYIRDTLARLCAESSDRIPKWLIPVIRINLDNHAEIRRSAAVVASWARYAEGLDEDGNHIEVVDRLKPTLMAAAKKQHQEPLAFIANREIFGDLIDSERFVKAYTDALTSLHERGAKETIRTLLR
ncbi:mannitol dehydrogenase family protein [Paenarthrobacter sp. Z7-10]|uniref:mannitol dehydrogenase family protein n=1 Tax=Paenarthrobacter sp. Z7-10 TaxID=2787635 RepID=UPI0022A989E3|nr:mannitol dehydrogenase family protein [Paenarthrobacter sp. Z7-10]MCZ2403903.1 mannitol dehydrogenase family protein [Paenarthrobacter sp. Z7-10]